MAKKKYKRRKIKYKIKLFFKFILFLLIVFIAYYLYNLLINSSPILSITNKNNNLIIELNDDYKCLFDNEYIIPDINDDRWENSDNENKCYTKFDNSK